MHRTIGYLSKRLTQIRPGEGRKVLLTFAYFFCIISAYYVIKPASRALVLDELGHRLIPYADLICAILMGPVITLFARCVNYVPKPRLVSMSFGAISAGMIGFWLLLGGEHPWVAGLFYIWVAIFSVLVVTLFWLVANDIYRLREAKRLFGFVGSGGILGGIAGSSLASIGAQIVGTRNLLLASAGLLGLSWLIVRQLWAYAPSRADPSHPEPRETFLSDLRGFTRLLLESRYLLLLVALVGLGKLVGTFVYYQFNPFIEQAFLTVDAKTTFNGAFFGATNALAFVVQFFLTSWILRRWGLLSALLVLPVVLLFGAGALLAAPVFMIAAGTELCDRSLDYSLNNTAKEMLYLPIDRSVRYKVKPFIDMVVFRFGKGIAAVTAIILLDGLGLSVQYLSVVTIPLILLWIGAAMAIRREYTMRIRTVLRAHAVMQPSAAGQGSSGASAELSALGSLTADRSAEPKLALMQQLLGASAADGAAEELLSRLRQSERGGGRNGRTQLGYELAQLKQAVQNGRVPMALRREAIRLLARRQDQDTVDYLCGLLLIEREAMLAQDVSRSLVRLRVAKPALQFPAAQIHRQIGREVANYVRIHHVARIYRQQSKGPLAPADPVLGLLRIFLEESVEQIFRLLMLLYRPEDIHLVYEHLRAADAYLRADAMELLDNLVDPAMRATLLPILDEDRFLSLFDEPAEAVEEPTVAYRVFQEAIWDHNSWLGVTVICAVGRLQLAPMRQELERAARQKESLIASAAKAALQPSTSP